MDPFAPEAIFLFEGFSIGLRAVCGVKTQQVPTVRRRDRKLLRQVMISIVATTLCLVAAETAALYWHSLSVRESPPDFGPRLSLVVLPFNNLDHDPQTALIADAFTEELTDDLSHTSDGMVIIPSSTIANNKTVDPKQIGRELRVRYVVRGSLQRINRHARVQIQLIDTENSGLLWTDQFETENQQLMEPDSEITGRLAATLQHALTEAVAQRIGREKEGHRDARDFVTLAIAARFHSDSRENRQKAQFLYEKALAIDPQSAAARIGIASVLIDNVAVGWTSPAEPDEMRAEYLLREALERAPTSSRAHLFMGVLRRLQNRLHELKAELETALARSRNYAPAHRQLGITMMFLGLPERGIPHIEKGIRLSPYDQNVQVALWALGSCHLLLGHIEEAIELLHKARAIAPGYPNAHLWLAGALGLRGDLGQANQSLGEAIRINSDFASLSRLRVSRPYYTNPHFRELAEGTVNAGLRAAGMRDE